MLRVMAILAILIAAGVYAGASASRSRLRNQCYCRGTGRARETPFRGRRESWYGEAVQRQVPSSRRGAKRLSSIPITVGYRLHGKR